MNFHKRSQMANDIITITTNRKIIYNNNVLRYTIFITTSQQYKIWYSPVLRIERVNKPGLRLVPISFGKDGTLHFQLHRVLCAAQCLRSLEGKKKIRVEIQIFMNISYAIC